MNLCFVHPPNTAALLVMGLGPAVGQTELLVMGLGPAVGETTSCPVHFLCSHLLF